MNENKPVTIKSFLLQNTFAIFTSIVALLNLWFLSQLAPLQSDIRTNARDIVENRTEIIESRSTLVKLMENVSSIKADVQYIRGKIE